MADVEAHEPWKAILADRLRAVLDSDAGRGDGTVVADEVARFMLGMALAGDFKMLRVILDRVDGKVGDDANVMDDRGVRVEVARKDEACRSLRLFLGAGIDEAA